MKGSLNRPPSGCQYIPRLFFSGEDFCPESTFNLGPLAREHAVRKVERIHSEVFIPRERAISLHALSNSRSHRMLRKPSWVRSSSAIRSRLPRACSKSQGVARMQHGT